MAAKKRGRPRVEIDKNVFEGLCGLQCTAVEIADFFHCSHDTVERWCKRTYKKPFNEVFAEYRAPGVISLRRKQFKLAETSAAMAIFLGKNYLNQSDCQKVEVTKTTDETIDTINSYIMQRKNEDEEEDDKDEK